MTPLVWNRMNKYSSYSVVGWDGSGIITTKISCLLPACTFESKGEGVPWCSYINAGEKFQHGSLYAQDTIIIIITTVYERSGA